MAGHPLQGLARILFGRHWRQGVICVVVRTQDELVSAWDESEAQNPRDVFAVAACVSTAGQWERFARQWSREFPSGAIFHATEWEDGKRGYGAFNYLATWTKREQRDKERKLRWIIEEHTLRSYVSAGPGTPHFAKYAGILDVHDDPYIDNMFNCMAVIHFSKEQGTLPNQAIRCMFERRTKEGDRRLDSQYDRISEQWFGGSFGASVIGRKDDPTMAPLQAADFIAHYTMKEAREWMRGRRGRHVITDALPNRMALNRKLLRIFLDAKGHDALMRAVLKEHVEKVVPGKLVLPAIPPKRIRKREQ